MMNKRIGRVILFPMFLKNPAKTVKNIASAGTNARKAKFIFMILPDI